MSAPTISTCWCCHATILGDTWTVRTPNGLLHRLCVRCAPHATMAASGMLTVPANCPNGRTSHPALRVVRDDG